MIVDELDISKDTVWKIVVEDLKKKGNFAHTMYRMH
jgi:biotin operon repressor